MRLQNLGYASTIHGAQGATVDTTHTVLNGTESRQALYVALSRGRQTNHLYLATPTASLDGVVPEVQDPVTEPRQVLDDILARDGRALSAMTVERGEAAQLLREAVLAYQDALSVLAQQHLGPERMSDLDDALEQRVPGITAQPAYLHLRGQLALRWVDGTAPLRVVEQATWYRGTQSVAEAEDPAAALAWRIAGATPPSHRDAPLPWLPDVPPPLRHQPEANDYLGRLTDRIGDLEQRVRGEAHQVGATDRLPWQRSLPPDVDDHLIGDLAVWRAAQGIPATEPKPAGPSLREPHAARHHARLVRRLGAPAPPASGQASDAGKQRLRVAQRAVERQTVLDRPGVDAAVPR